MKITIELLKHINDGDFHTKISNVEYSTNLREIVTIGYMLEHSQSLHEGR